MSRQLKRAMQKEQKRIAKELIKLNPELAHTKIEINLRLKNAQTN
jgi:hypothetical protein